MNLSTPIEQIPRIGPQYQKRLKRLGIETVNQLLFHFPHRYDDYSNVTPIIKIEPDQTVCVQGEIEDIKSFRLFKKRMTIIEAKIKDETGSIRVTWFNQPYLINTLKPGDYVFLAGKTTKKNGKTYLSAPAYEKIPPQLKKVEQFDSTHTGRLIPIYPETEGMSSRWLRFIIKPLLTNVKKTIPDSLPKDLKEKNNLLDIKEAIWQIHFPDSLKKAKEAKKRFIFEELFSLALALLREKVRLTKEKSTSIKINLELIKEYIDSLPFKLTDDQKKSTWQILKDMEKNKPMNRLLDGDVGSGKTIVAVIATLNAVKEGFQTAFMAPTEILSKQHHKTLLKSFEQFNFDIGLITGKENYINNEKVKRKELLEKVLNHEIDILIGTHALVQETVQFKKLGLVVIDEQHRFGIDQRAKLTRKQNFIPHLLSMSATPIPRTLSLTMYGDLDLSLIKEMPKGRKKIITEIIPPGKRSQTYEFIRKEVKKGRQAFVICPRIDIPENNEAATEMAIAWRDVKAVKEEYEKLSKQIFPKLNVSMLHGRMKAEEKEETLKQFKDKKTDILVSTSVVEVGIDFPNATIMMIEGSDKFGLAQLHQFRGRVGRGEHQSYCLLFSDFPNNPRLKAMQKSQDGFELAEKDLKLRGPGDLTGQRQWGVPSFVMSAMIEDLELVEQTRKAAGDILSKDPELKKHSLLREKLERFRKRIHLE